MSAAQTSVPGPTTDAESVRFCSPFSVLEGRALLRFCQDLMPREQKVYLALCKNRNARTGTAWQSAGTLAEETGLSRRNVFKALAGLKKKGWIVPDGVSQLQTVCYLVKRHPDDPDAWGEIATDGEENTRGDFEIIPDDGADTPPLAKPSVGDGNSATSPVVVEPPKQTTSDNYQTHTEPMSGDVEVGMRQLLRDPSWQTNLADDQRTARADHLVRGFLARGYPSTGIEGLDALASIRATENPTTFLEERIRALGEGGEQPRDELEARAARGDLAAVNAALVNGA